MKLLKWTGYSGITGIKEQNMKPLNLLFSPADRKAQQSANGNRLKSSVLVKHNSRSLKQILLILLFSAAASLSAVSNAASLARLYKVIPVLEVKYSLMQELTILNDRSLEPFYTEALDELVYGELARYRIDKSTRAMWVEITRLVVEELGEIKGQNIAEPLWDLARTAESSLLKSDSLAVLGRIQATEYADSIAESLQVLNLNDRPDKDNAEIEAYGAIVALSRLQGPKGFEALFYASFGWYRDNTIKLADRIILTSFKEPIPLLTDIIKAAEYNPPKTIALKTALRVDAPNTEKLKAVVAALEEGLYRSGSDKSYKNELADLRLSAIEAYIDIGESYPGVPKLLEQSIDEGDITEKLSAIKALGTDGSSEAVAELSHMLTAYSDRQNNGVTLSNDEDLIVRQLAFSLGEANSSEGLPALEWAAVSDYTPALQSQINQIIKKIQGN